MKEGTIITQRNASLFSPCFGKLGYHMFQHTKDSIPAQWHLIIVISAFASCRIVLHSGFHRVPGYPAPHLVRGVSLHMDEDHLLRFSCLSRFLRGFPDFARKPDRTEQHKAYARADGTCVVWPGRGKETRVAIVTRRNDGDGG